MKEKAADYRPPFFTPQEIDMSLNSFITLGRSDCASARFASGA